MKLTTLIILVLLVCVKDVIAQTDYRNGFVIIHSGDTLSGQIDYRSDLIMSTTCRFRNDSITQIYTPNDISAFRFTDSKYFVCKEVNNQMVFLEYLIKGKVEIYYMRDELGDHYYLEKEGVQLSEIPYVKDVKSINGRDMYYESTRHIGFLKYYMQDAPEIQTKIQNFKQPDHNNLIKLAEAYHYAVCEDEECIIYEKQQPFIKVNLETVAGVVNFPNNPAVEEGYHFLTGALVHLWMPRLNEKVYFKTGLMYSPVKETVHGLDYYLKIPIHIGYMAPKTYRIRPTVSMGVLSPSYSGGVNVKINDHINLGIQSWANFEFDKVPWLPQKLDNYSILGNLYIEF